MESRTIPERIAVLEERSVSIDARTARTEGKVDLLVEWMTQEKTRRKGLTEVFGAGRSIALVVLPLVSMVLAIFAAAKAP